MAITIIGASRSTDEEKSPLSRAEVDLPQPASAPANRRVLDDQKLRTLLAHEQPMVRSFALEQASHLEGDTWSEEIAKKVDDTDDMVATDAIQSLEYRKYKPAAAVIAERFKSGSTPIVISAARALGELSPERLLDVVGQKGRMEDEAYGATATAIACVGSNEVIDYLDRALNRSGAMTPERRGALYGAALLSGSTPLSNRVLSVALADSKKDEPENASFPSRGALAAVAGMPLPASRKAAGLELYDFARTVIEAELLPIISEEQRTALDGAVKRKDVAGILAGLEPVLSLPDPETKTGEGVNQASMPKRRRGLLRALIERRDEIGALPLPAAVVFLAAAVQAAIVVAAGGVSDAHSPALVALAKALESSIDAGKLATMSEEELTAFFRDKSERQMRRVHNVITHERVRRLDTMKRFVHAIFKAGHGQGLFESAADVTDESIRSIIVEALTRTHDIAEQTIVDALTRSPLEPKLATLALEAADRCRTERVALAIGRRFHELRELARPQLVRAVLRVADARLIPLVESRAFPNEPEELAWSLLSLIHDLPQTQKLEAAIKRNLTDTAPHEPGQIVNLTLPLRCKRCKETLTYGFARVLLDIETKDPYGDPAYVGDTTCKACGVDNELEPTEEAGRTLTSMMLDFLGAMRRGIMQGSPLVAPAQTQLNGKPMGFALALRTLDKDIASSPTSIRAHLHRARLRLILDRRGIEEDINAALAVDPRSPEAKALSASLAARRQDLPGAIAFAAEAYELLRPEANARIYDVEDARGLQQSLEDLLVEMERQGGTVPGTIDLAAARTRRSERERQLEEERVPADEDVTGGDDVMEAAGARGDVDPKGSGRNDPCPCGSGKKFKKCHGRGR